MESGPGVLSKRLEERDSAALHAPPTSTDLMREGHAHHHDHPTILSARLLPHLSTNHQDSYRCPAPSHALHTGRRTEKLRRYLYNTFRQEELEERSAAVQEVKVEHSMSRRDYVVEGFSPQTPRPRKSRHYSSEQPLSFWAEHLHNIPGVSPVTQPLAPFTRSSAFTTPTSQCLDLPELHSLDTYPTV